MTDGPVERFHPEFRVRGLTDLDGTAAHYLRVKVLAASKDVVLGFGCSQAAHANARVRTRLVPNRRQ